MVTAADNENIPRQEVSGEAKTQLTLDGAMPGNRQPGRLG
jgi:hypothetical protein